VPRPNSLPAPRLTAHAVVDLPIAGRNGAALPLLLLGDGEVSLHATSYLRNLLFTGTDTTTVSGCAKAIGRFYDFYMLEKKSPTLDNAGLRQLVKMFYEARRFGLPSLGWAPVKRATAQNDLRHITHFSAFCATNFGHLEANPTETRLVEHLSGAEFQLWMARAEARKKWDLLLHAFPTTKEGKGEIAAPQFRPEMGKGKKPGKAPKFFPPNKVVDFISQARNVRDTLCWLLIFFGGLRISELAHIFLRDVTVNKDDGTAQVIVAHPGDGQIDWVDGTGRKRNGTRAAFLLDRYGLIPRDQLPSKHPLHAGWKGMLYDDVNRSESVVYWLDPDMGRLFYRLHQQYLKHIRLLVGDTHPYYFIGLKGEGYGEPMKLGALHDQFDSCVARAGIPKTRGVSPHGGRHFYGYFCANWLKVTKERAQKMLHHGSILSTEVYYTLDSATVRAELAQAHERMKAALPSILQNKDLLLSMGDTND